MEGLILHENHVSDLKTIDKIFNGRSKVTTTGPNILDEGNLIRRDSECFSEPSEVKFDGLFFKEFIVIRIVKYLDTKHDEPGVMSSGYTNIIKIIKSHRELRADKRVSGRIKLSSDTVWLETVNSCGNKVDIISPSGNNRVSLDSSARDSSRGEAVLETLPGLSKGHFLSVFLEAFSNE